MASITKPASGGPSKAATPRRKVRIPNTEVSSSRPSKSTWSIETHCTSYDNVGLLTKSGEVTAIQAERDKPKRIQTMVKDQKSKQIVIRNGQRPPEN